VRLFVAVWPPDEVIGLVASIPRPEVQGLRWTTRSQWHVTLRFLGEVDEGAVDQVADALRSLAGSGVAEVVLGPATAWFPGRRVLQVPLAGLDELQDSLNQRVNDAIARSGVPEGGLKEPEGMFNAHLTIARARGRGRMDRVIADSLAGVSIDAAWTVTSVSLVASSLEPDGAHYSDIVAVALG
jgi:RNA 2',3'-cyclic 3'-phosphodiesterase